MYRRYAGRADFYLIYIREAHPADGWRMASNDRAGVILEQPRSTAERAAAARELCSSQSVGIPVLVDAMDDSTAEAFSAFPDRLYIVDRQGRIVFKGGRGPMGFDTGSLEQALCLVLLEETGRPF